MSKGARAMALAVMFPEAEAGGRGKKGEATNYAETAGFSTRRLQEARLVLKHASDQIDGVIAGTIPLNIAYGIARERWAQKGSIRTLAFGPAASPTRRSPTSCVYYHRHDKREPAASVIYMKRFLKHWRLTRRGEAFRAPVISYADYFVILSRGHAAEAGADKGQ